MLYYENLEEVIFGMHEMLTVEPDELIIISGYLGPSPIERLKEIPVKTTVIGGMYANGINEKLYNSLNKSKSENPNLKILFTTNEVHSKIYIWKKSNNVLRVLIGSANFSANGLRSNIRETLAEVNRMALAPIDNYLKLVKDVSTETPIIKEKPIATATSEDDFGAPPIETIDGTIAEMPLSSGGKVQAKSGLNWGFQSGHGAEGDAYIAVYKETLRKSPKLFPAFDPKYENEHSKKARQSPPIELIWDDGTIMSASLEGKQTLNGVDYPKQISSYSPTQPFLPDGTKISKKSILGRYLRNRLGVSVTHQITMKDLVNYGRTTITLSLIEEGVYYADFSVKKS